MLKISLFVLSFSFVSTASFAVDTSGCALVSATKQAVTTNSRLLSVTALQPSRPGCWNASEARVQVAYQWQQSSSALPSNVGFWVKLKGQETSLNAQVSCAFHQSPIGYAKDTSNSTEYLCTASATLPVGSGSVDLEVAPHFENAWDTSGYGSNYRFQF